MALRLLGRSLGCGQNFCAPNETMYLHKNRKYVIQNKRGCSKCPACVNQPIPEKDPCAHKVCNRKPKKKSFWKRLFESSKEETARDLPPKACCRQQKEKDNVPGLDPDLTEFGGEAYKTCGPAYLVQKDTLPSQEVETSKEEYLVRKMEADPEFKSQVNLEPLPKFKSAELRMLDLSDKKLHPLYKKYSGIKKRYLQEQKQKQYKTVSWPIDMHEIPARLNINSEVVDKKNMEFLEFKRIDPPRQLVERIVELQINARPAMDKGSQRAGPPVDLRDVERRQEAKTNKDSVFETLNMQRGSKY